MTRIRFVPILVTAIVTLLVLFGGWEYYQKFNVVDPLTQQLNKIHGVKSSNVVAGTPNVVSVTLGNVPDLQTTYKNIEQMAQTSLHGSLQIRISGTPDARLKQEYEDIMPTVMQGMANGNYSEMIQGVTKMTQQAGITSHVTMDSQDIFLQMSDGSKNLYSVIPLKTP